MKINYNITGAARKSLVGAISQELNAPTKYLGMPTAAYEVGEYIIDKTGTVTGPDNRELVADLQGLHSFVPVSEEYDAPITETEDGMRSSDVPDSDENILTIELPKDGFTEATVANLEKLVESKAALIKNALGADSLTIEQTEDTLRFPWFRLGISPEEINAYSRFIGALCAMAKEQKRVTAKEKPVDNEKYAFRCFLLRLGFIGEDCKAERKILLSKLSGNGSFKSGERKPTITAEPEVSADDSEETHSGVDTESEAAV